MHKIKILLLAGQILMGTLDSRVTRQRITTGGVELNPLGRPFVHSPTLYASNAGLSLGLYWLGRRLEKRHPKLSLLPQTLDLAGHTTGWLYTRR